MKARSGSRLHMTFYWLLYALLGASAIGFALSFKYPAFWDVYKRVYFIVLLAYVWYIFALLFIGERQSKQSGIYKGESIAVLVPVYNEDEPLLIKCLASVWACQGNKTIFVLDDGSVKGINKQRLQLICDKNRINVKFFPVNRGKRHVLFDGVKALDGKFDYVVTIDSDTVLAKDALVKLVAGFSSPKVGAASGAVHLINERQNWVTRMAGAYYWIATNIAREAQSTFGYVACCSGCLSCYRGEIIDRVIDELIAQAFMGEACSHSEDRYLTNLVLRDGYNVKYVAEAVSYTSTPDTIRGFLKQQQRWKRGFIRESTFLLTFAWRTHPMLFIQTILCDLTLPFIVFGVTLDAVFTAIRSPSDTLIALVPFYLAFTVVRNLPLLFHAPKKIGGVLIYAIFSDLVLYYQSIWALFTTKNKRWLTR